MIVARSARLEYQIDLDLFIRYPFKGLSFSFLCLRGEAKRSRQKGVKIGLKIRSLFFSGIDLKLS